MTFWDACFNGVGQPIDGGPELLGQRRVDVGGPSVNPIMRVVPSKMIETKVPMIDVFNCLVESQKIPIFSIAGEPYNELLARIAIQADADVVVFCGLGLIFDEFHFFRDTFENEGVFPRTVMFANRASDPIVERLLAPDLALKVAERFAVEQNKRVSGVDDRHDGICRRPERDRRGDGTHPIQPRLHGRLVQPTGVALRAGLRLPGCRFGDVAGCHHDARKRRDAPRS